MLASFDRVVASGMAQLVLVSGRPGIGKSSVVNELHKVLVPPRGLFASGKFDQLKRDIPYATLAQAFQSLTRRLLSKPETELAKWRDELRRALEPNAALVVELIPELKLVIGEQPAVLDVPPHAAKLRFQMTLRRLIGVFARPEHPLALFLDDLQWLDAASLDLLEALLVEPDLHHLLLVGAYRDNEVDEAHSLMRKLAAIRKTGTDVQHIVLGPLTDDDLAQLLADTFHCVPRPAMPLARLVHEKTAGNPFFTSQFIQQLVADGLVTFDPRAAGWRWDLGPIRAKGHADNVLDLMVGRLGRLSRAAQQALKNLACLGNSAEAATLAIVHGTSDEELESDLWEALRLEVILRSEDSYRFVHDRVQEAAYSLIPQEERAPAHLRIGRLLSTQIAPDKREEAIFEIVGHFNRAAALVTSQDEREGLAALNLAAAKRAKVAAAYASALNYLTAGAALLDQDGWQRHDLAFELELRRSECELLTGQVASAEDRLRVLSSRATMVVERAAVVCLQADVYLALQRPDLGLSLGADCVRQAGLEIPLHPTEADAQAAYDWISSQLEGVGIEDLAALPSMSDSTSRAVLDVLAKISICAAIIDKNFEVLIASSAIELSLRHGVHDGSCHAFEQLGYLAGWRYGNFEACFRFGRLGYELIERKGLHRFAGHVCLMFSTLVMPWAKHVATYRHVIRQTVEVSQKTGDGIWAVQSANVLLSNLLLAGDPLVEVEHEAEVSVALCRTSSFTDFTNAVRTQEALVRTLRGLTRRFGTLDDGRFDEHGMESHFASQPHLLCSECWYWIRKLQARFFAGDYLAALDCSSRAQGLLSESPGMLERAEHELYSALTHAALCDPASGAHREQHLTAMIAHHRQLEFWARHCPDNFENRALLVAAEIAGVEGRDLDATHLYERAIRSARDGGFINNEALGLEVAARFYAARGFERTARAYLRDARHAYGLWGADGKVRQLEEHHPFLREQERRADPERTMRAHVDHLDLATVLRVSQAVAGETDLEKLVATVMRLGLEQAGAERGLLILPEGDVHRIEAEARTGDEGVVVDLRQAEITAADLPKSVLQYVLRTRESILLHDASSKNAFSDDEYLRTQHVRSVLCMPLLKQTRLAGVIYLENNLTSGAFTPARMAVLQLLASDAAISLENARLYRDLREREARVRRLVDSNIIGIFIWHSDGRILDTNEAFLRIVGHTREDLLSGRGRWTEFTAPGWEDRLIRGVEEVSIAKAAEPREWEYVKKDGTRVPVLVGGALFDDARDEGVAFVLDLTEFKRAEQAVRDGERRYHEVQIRLADANRIASIGELSASIAHEINQPLSGIITNAGTCLRMLTADPPNVDAASETARRALRDGHRASEVITRLRALFATKKTDIEPVDVNEAAWEVLGLFSKDAQRAQVTLQTELCEGRCVVLGDRVQLQQVILNLLRNATDAMRNLPDDRKQLIIRTELTSGDRVLLTVRDSGIGLGSQNPERLFEAFYSTKEFGMGIGLSVSRSIIESHQGTLWAVQNDGPGATFSFSLPIVGK